MPSERALASGLAQNTIDSMNSVIQAMRSVIYDRCLMAGGYPTFLLGKTTKFFDIDFVLILKSQVDYYSFYINFAKLIEEQLDPDKKWQFKAYCHLPLQYCVTIKDVPLSEKSSITFVSRQMHYPVQVVKLKTDDVNIADFCFFVQNCGPDISTIDKESVVTSLLKSNKAITRIHDSYDSHFVMNVACFGPDGDLHCYDVSDENDINKVDKKCIPIFIDKVSEDRYLKYKERVSKNFKCFVREMRRIKK